MTNAGQSLYDSLKHIVESLQARFLLPSITLTTGSILIFEVDFKFTSPEHTILLISIVIISSYLFNALNGIIIRLMEGYEFKDNIVFSWLLSRQIKKKEIIMNAIRECEKDYLLLKKYEQDILCDDSPDDIEKLQQIEDAILKVKNRETSLYEIKNNYYSSDIVLPTAIGNVIKSFEEYPLQRYGMDSVNIWPRMCSIVKQDGFLSVIENEKVTLDFLANTGFVTIIFSLQFLFSFAFINNSPLIFLGAIFSLCLSYLLFYSTVAVAQDWGKLVCCAFDLYRDDLRKALNLPTIPNNDLQSEKELWSAFSHFIIYGEIPKRTPFNGFIYQSLPRDEKSR